MDHKMRRNHCKCLLAAIFIQLKKNQQPNDIDED